MKEDITQMSTINATKVLENQMKHMWWLQMLEATCFLWMIKQVDKMNWL